MAIKHLIKAHRKDLGGFSVRRFLPYSKQRMVGPWIFFDHMGPADFPAGEGIDVRPHPHINLATVTYLLEGEILHRDSLGSKQAINPGDINLMVAGKGITHSEREREEVRGRPHRLSGLQLWHALPADQEEIDPAFYHYPAADIPHFNEDGAEIRVIMGKAFGFTSPVKTFAETLYLEATIDDGGTLLTPKAEQIAIYVISGEVTVENQTLKAYEMGILEDGTLTTLRATESARIAIVGGEKMPHRHIEWNFVSSRKERIDQAKDDWYNQRFPKVPGDDKEFTPLP